MTDYDMNKLLYILIAVLLAACSAHKPTVAPPVVLNHSDTIMRDTCIVTRIDTVRVSVEIPVQSVIVNGLDSVSHLETDYAVSDAWINSWGGISHRLRNKPQTVAFDALVPSTTTHISASSQSVREVPVHTPVYVERALTWWQQFRLNSFWYLVFFLIVSLLWIFKRPILSLVR